MTSFEVKKRYAMDIVGAEDLSHKGNAMVKSEHIKFVKRKVKELFSDTLMRPTGKGALSLYLSSLHFYTHLPACP